MLCVSSFVAIRLDIWTLLFFLGKAQTDAGYHYTQSAKGLCPQLPKRLQRVYVPQSHSLLSRWLSYQIGKANQNWDSKLHPELSIHSVGMSLLDEPKEGFSLIGGFDPIGFVFWFTTRKGLWFASLFASICWSKSKAVVSRNKFCPQPWW